MRKFDRGPQNSNWKFCLLNVNNIKPVQTGFKSLNSDSLSETIEM